MKAVVVLEEIADALVVEFALGGQDERSFGPVDEQHAEIAFHLADGWLAADCEMPFIAAPLEKLWLRTTSLNNLSASKVISVHDIR